MRVASVACRSLAVSRVSRVASVASVACCVLRVSRVASVACRECRPLALDTRLEPVGHQTPLRALVSRVPARDERGSPLWTHAVGNRTQPPGSPRTIAWSSPNSLGQGAQVQDQAHQSEPDTAARVAGPGPVARRDAAARVSLRPLSVSCRERASSHRFRRGTDRHTVAVAPTRLLGPSAGASPSRPTPGGRVPQCTCASQAGPHAVTTPATPRGAVYGAARRIRMDQPRIVI